MSDDNSDSSMIFPGELRRRGIFVHVRQPTRDTAAGIVADTAAATRATAPAGSPTTPAAAGNAPQPAARDRQHHDHDPTSRATDDGCQQPNTGQHRKHAGLIYGR